MPLMVCESRRSCCGKPDIVFSDPVKGGVDIPLDERKAVVVVAANGRILRFPQARAWLKGIIRDPRSGKSYNENANAFVQRARREIIILASGRETGISRDNAIALHRLFLIRDTTAFQNVMDMYDDQQQPE